MSPTLTADATLTPGQTAVLYGHLAEPESSQYQCAELLNFTGEVDLDHLAATITTCFNQLAAFQSEYILDEDGQPRKVPHPHHFEVEVLDLPVDTDPVTWAESAIELTGPLKGRTLAGNHLIRQAGKILWLTRIHHVIGDGFAIHALIRWIAESYTRGEVSDPPFAEHHTALTLAAEYEASEGFTADRQFWATQPLSTNPPALRPATGKENARAHGLASVSPEVRRGLRALARELTLSEADLLTALTAVYGARLSGSEDYTLGFPMLNRPMGARVALTPQANVLPLRLECPRGRTLAQQARDTAAAMAKVKAHGAYRSEWLRRDLRIADPDTRLWGADVNIRPFSVIFPFAQAQATLQSIAVGPVGDVEIIYQMLADGGLMVQLLATSGYPAEELSAHATRLADLLARVVAQGAELNLDELPMVTETEQETLIEGFNDTTRELETEVLAGLIDSARQHLDPQATALYFGEQQLNRADYDHQVDGLAAQLITQLQLHPGQVIAVHLHRSPALLIAVAAVVRAGAAFVPISPDLPEERRRVMLEQSGAVGVIHGGDPFPGQLPGIELPEDRVHVTTASAPADFAPVRPGPDELAYVLFTSGSTGTPKAVAVGQRAIVNRLAWMTRRLGINASTTLIQKTPISFDVSVWELLLPLTHACPITVATPDSHLDPRVLAAQMIETGVEVAHFVPSALSAFVAVVEAEGIALPALRQVIASGEALDPVLASRTLRVLGVELDNLYGPAEAAIDVTAHACQLDEGLTPIGGPVDNTRLYVLDDADHPQPIGYPGRLMIAGIQVGLGYLGQPELSSEKFRADPYVAGGRLYDSGDLVSWTPVGTLLFHGRRDGQVKLRGQRLDLGEVSAAAAGTRGVSGAVTLLKQLAGSAALITYVTGEVTPAAVREECARLLPAYMVPAAVVKLVEFPLTRNGKLDTSQLPEAEIRAEFGEASNEKEAQVCQIFSEVLGGVAVGPETRFFEAGGTSLTAVSLAVALSEQLGVTVGIADVFAAHSPRELLAALGQEEQLGLARLLSLRAHTSGVPVICLHPAGGLGWSYTGLLPFLDQVRGVIAVQSPGLDGGPQASSLAQEAAEVAEALCELGHPQIDLVGWSVGGVLAQELSCVLAELPGAPQVRKLCLLDAYPAELWRSLPAPTEWELLEGVLTMAGTDAHPGEELDLERVIARISAAGSAFAQLGDQTLRRVIRLIGHNAALMKSHRTRRSDLKVEMFKAERNPQHMDEQAWEPFLGELRVHRLDVTHPQLVAPAQLRYLGEVLV
ncbi:Enterobactin synthase component F [Corynebacterium occultum]|uniref:Enterobactin synthase component F n=1 Tax=Corynebacterium occultum TaxID=2675219 RepID=A0A6B8VV53_9CORY|nr:non-ribosomal peptide synthetase [Corynebacterium occultum]QGU08013.1 Enterobactin synthase component F [Corynebacterium occultum]